MPHSYLYHNRKMIFRCPQCGGEKIRKISVPRPRIKEAQRKRVPVPWCFKHRPCKMRMVDIVIWDADTESSANWSWYRVLQKLLCATLCCWTHVRSTYVISLLATFVLLWMSTQSCRYPFLPVHQSQSLGCSDFTVRTFTRSCYHFTFHT